MERRKLQQVLEFPASVDVLDACRILKARSSQCPAHIDNRYLISIDRITMPTTPAYVNSRRYLLCIDRKTLLTTTPHLNWRRYLGRLSRNRGDLLTAPARVR